MESLGGVRQILDIWHEQDQPGKQAFLDDLPFALQGISTERFRDIDGALTVVGPVNYGDRTLLRRLIEPGALYRSIRNVLAREPRGLVLQALHQAVSDELQNYLVLVGALEKRIRSRDEAVNYSSCSVWLREATEGMRVLYTLMADAEVAPADVLSNLFRYTQHGDEFVATLASRLLEKAQVPFSAMLDHWVATGTLNDPFDEFFVQVVDTPQLWAGRFAFRGDRVPQSLGLDTAHKSFEIGKSLYFLRVLCDDHEFVLARQTGSRSAESIEDSYRRVLERVNEQLSDRFSLHKHFTALRDYLLLTKGDFVESLVQEAQASLHKPARELHRLELLSILDAAISNSNANFEDQAVLQRLDARMLDSGHGEMGWQVFTLEYKLDSPLDVIIDSRAARHYLRIFNMLWQLRWASHALTQTWKRVTLGQRGPLGQATAEQELAEPWHTARETLQIMSRFSEELLLYIYTEVIERQWKAMYTKLDAKAPTVDEIIEIHSEFLSNITSRALFGRSSVIDILHSLVKRILSFDRTVDSLYYMTVNRQVVHDPQRFERIVFGVEELQNHFVSEVRTLILELDALDDDSRAFATRLNFNYFYDLRI